MLNVENKSKEEIARIGRKIGEAFAAEKAGIVTMLTYEQTVKAFEIMTDYFYRAGVLYSTSETGEGYLACLEKKAKSAISPALHMIKRFLCELPLKASLTVMRSGGEQYAKIFKREQNYIAVHGSGIAGVSGKGIYAQDSGAAVCRGGEEKYSLRP